MENGVFPNVIDEHGRCSTFRARTRKQVEKGSKNPRINSEEQKLSYPSPSYRQACQAAFYPAGGEEQCGRSAALRALRSACLGEVSAQ